LKQLTALLLLLAASIGCAIAKPTIVARDAWSRPAIATGVVYVSLANHARVADRLLGADSPVARAVELHESTETKGSGMAMNGMAMGSITSMHPVAFIRLPARRTVRLAPGGYHIMLIGLKHELRAGQSFPLVLRFAHADTITVAVHVMR